MYKTVSFFQKRVCNRLRKMNNIAVIEDSFESIKKYLCQFEGGKVDLTKNEETGVATLVLKHPERKNALSGSKTYAEIFMRFKLFIIPGRMMVELRECIQELEKWDTGKAVILCGEGGNFCSGGDLNFARASGTAEAGLKLSTLMQDSMKRLQRLPLVSVCLAEGPTLGAGAELSIFCDFIIAADNVHYGFVHGKMGIVTACGGGTRLASKIGAHKALDLLLTSKILSANECVDVGLAEGVVPAEEALSKTEEWLKPRLQHHYSVIRAMKEIIHNSSTSSYEDSLEYEKDKFAPFWGSEPNREVLSKYIKHVKKP